jgi:hypothetical protein
MPRRNVLLAVVCLSSLTALAERPSGPLQAWVVIDGDHTHMTGNLEDADVARKASGGAKRYFWFRTQGKTYGTGDAALLDELTKAWAPVTALGEDMSKLGEQQSRFGEQMSTIGERMGKLGEQLGKGDLGGERAKVEASMKQASANMDALSAKMTPLSQQMDVLSKRMDVLSAQAQRRVNDIAMAAKAKGLARAL